MKRKKVSAVMPLLAGIGLGIVSLALPFLLANHYIWAEGKRYSADNLLFFFWGKYYTVAGTKMIQSKMVMYDLGDYPIYAMITIAIGLVLAAISIFGGRGIILNIKGREVKFKFDTNPIWLQTYSVLLLIIAYIYMNNATEYLVNTLERDNYFVEYGPALDFLLGSLIAMVTSIVMTTVKYMRTKNDTKNKQKTILKTDKTT